MENKNTTSTMSFGTVLTLIFITLKLCGVITWSWVWVLCPVWIGLIIIALLVVTLIIVKTVKQKKEKI